MDVGLDELIRKKRNTGASGNRNRGPPRNRGFKKDLGRKMFSNGGVRGKPSLMDARAMINARKKVAIRDAREKLNSLQRQKDARLRISSSNSSRAPLNPPRSGSANRLTNLMPARTIKNSIRQLSRATMDSFPYSAASRSNGRSPLNRGANSEELMDVDRRSWDPASLPQLEVLLLRPNSTPYSRPRELRTNKEQTWLRPSPAIRRSDESIKSRLEPLRQEEGYRIVVSNLQPTVTHEDIKELFEDIGPLIGSRVVRPGTAEVVYRDLKDAVAAVDAYHNRQLDGQPMKCLLVKPQRSSTSSSKAVVGTKGMIVPDINTIHKALFMK